MLFLVGPTTFQASSATIIPVEGSLTQTTTSADGWREGEGEKKTFTHPGPYFHMNMGTRGPQTRDPHFHLTMSLSHVRSTNVYVSCSSCFVFTV